MGGVVQAITLIDTTTSWNGSEFIFPFGEPNTATYGQTFTVSNSDTQLNSFSFFVNGFDDPEVVTFAGYVMAWDGSKATGNILYQSSQVSTTANTGFEEFTFNTGGINLTQGQQYVAFLSASNFFNNTSGRGSMGAIGTNPYAGGQFVFFNNGNDFNLLTTQSWLKFLPNHDLAFKASFSSPQPIPEPLTILGTLVAGGVGLAFKRKSTQSKDGE